MTKLLITAAAFAALLPAQNNFQNPAWLGHQPQDANHALRPDGQQGPVIGKPFSGIETRTTRQMLSDGTPTGKTSTSKIYRDAQGRTRSESGSNVLIYDAVTPATYEIGSRGCFKRAVHAGDAVIVVATENGTWSSSQSGGSQEANPHITSEDLGYQTVNGISAQGTRQTLTIPATTIGADHDIKVVNERWYSDALGIMIKSSNIDPRFGSTTYELTAINMASPDPSLFNPPAGCTEPPIRRGQ
ncbi:MAG TPA: hypothetical protein VGL72_09185 [Bryobacteraceae bacterium]|jgi:hypothetical protein